MARPGDREPFATLFTQGMVTRDGAKMSKSRGNTVSPAEFVERYGADTTRAYICFMGPPVKGGDWYDQGVDGMFHFLSRVWRLSREVDQRTASGREPEEAVDGEAGAARRLLAKAHWAI